MIFKIQMWRIPYIFALDSQYLYARYNLTLSTTLLIHQDNILNVNFDFHMSLAELTGNTRLVNIVRLVLEHVMRFDSMLSRYSPSTSWVKHGRIMRAISAHDSIGAWRSMQKHIEQARLRILSVFAGHSAKLNLVPLRYGAAFSLPDGPGMQSTKGNQPTIPSLARGQDDDAGES